MVSESVPPGVAIVGMAARTAGADTVQELWSIIAGGDVTIPAGTSDPQLGTRDPLRFDADLFGISAREAELMDPQHRILLEVAWHAIEDAAWVPTDADVGAVYASVGVNEYFRAILPTVESSAQYFQASYSNAPDSVATRLAYHLGLTGEAVGVQTACSSSLAALHLAVASLERGDCDVALAGGVNHRLDVPAVRDQAGMIYSPDRRCRVFDAAADGTVETSGVGVVVLKRLERAQRDGDRIYAVIRASALNNDGSRKPGFTAPSREGQAEVIATVHAFAGWTGALDYLETHGTGTPIGDPTEVAALRDVFALADTRGICALGSLKANVGHTIQAAGILGLIKAALVTFHRLVPPCADFERANPALALDGSRFVVPTEATCLPLDRPVRAGVTSLGVGGTNVHVVLESAPVSVDVAAAGPGEPVRLSLAAGTATALERQRRELAEHLERERPALEDVAHTLARRRRDLEWTWSAVAADLDGALEALRDRPGAHPAIASKELRVASHGRVLSLPGYPFEGRVFDARVAAGAPTMTASPNERHLLVHTREWLLVDTSAHAADALDVLVGEVSDPLVVAAAERWRPRATVHVSAGSVMDVDEVLRPVRACPSGSLPPTVLVVPPRSITSAWHVALSRLCSEIVNSGGPASITLLAAGAHPGVTTGPLYEHVAGLIPIGLAAAQEAHAISFHVIAVDATAPDPASALSAASLVAVGRRASEVAVHGGRTLRPVLLPTEAAPVGGGVDVAGGTYVVLGGLGGIGRAVVRSLVARGASHVVLVNRGAVEDPAQWDQVGGAHRELLSLASQARIDVIDLDVGGPSAGHELRQRLGVERAAVRGVVHAAGDTSEAVFGSVSEISGSMIAAAGHARLGGCRTIASAFDVAAFEFIAVMSSMASLLGGVRFGAYGSANRMMDTWCANRRRSGERWYSVCWDTWDGRNHGAGRGAPVISPVAGTDLLFDDVLARQPGTYYITTPGAEARAAALVNARPWRDASVERPEAASIVEVVRRVFEKQLGMPVGGDDDLLASGGDSLALLDAVTEIEDAYGIELDAADVLAEPTVFGLVRLCEIAIKEAP